MLLSPFWNCKHTLLTYKLTPPAPPKPPHWAGDIPFLIPGHSTPSYFLPNFNRDQIYVHACRCSCLLRCQLSDWTWWIAQRCSSHRVTWLSTVAADMLYHRRRTTSVTYLRLRCVTARTPGPARRYSVHRHVSLTTAAVRSSIHLSVQHHQLQTAPRESRKRTVFTARPNCSQCRAL